jgi:hypothetical protein
MTYYKHFEAFHNNANYAARVFQYYETIEKSNTHNSWEHVALNKSARYWLDWRYMALQTVIITLFKIFDTQSRTLNMRAMLKALPENLQFYSTAALIERRKQGGMTDPEMLVGVASRSHDLNAADLKRFEKQAEQAEELWKKFEPLRHRIYAHHQMLSDEDRDRLYSKTTYKNLRRVILILLSMANALQQSELNGTKPDFRRKYISPFSASEREAKKLLKTLTEGVPKPKRL